MGGGGQLRSHTYGGQQHGPHHHGPHHHGPLQYRAGMISLSIYQIVLSLATCVGGVLMNAALVLNDK